MSPGASLFLSTLRHRLQIHQVYILLLHKLAALAIVGDLKKPLSDMFPTPCGHQYCQECLRTLFELSTSDETLFPPRCCRQEIPLQSVKLYLSSALIDLFEKKSIEFKTFDRTNCSQPICSSFIISVNISGERATCTACGTRT